MFRKIFFPILMIAVVGCASKKKTVSTRNPRPTVTVVASGGKETAHHTKKRDYTENSTADAIISVAMDYAGVRYKFGGTTKRGMDCSGLVYVALKENDILFPRISHQMAQEGKKIKVNQVQKGDLLFFDTQKRRRRINHVGLVVDVDGDEIKFIHSTSSRGVIVSSLREGYWNYAFVKATRIL
ncbi:C40 family peptidase [Allomuricauda sp. d1]|uniref:C40 family peptidase n=1 Tax=Allomuricauda sp. d1 TaxID=3136725 RepID=UPI0031CFC725